MFFLLRYIRPFLAKYLANWGELLALPSDKIRLHSFSSERNLIYISLFIMVLNIWVTSPDTHSERRIDPHITVEQLKVTPFLTLLPNQHPLILVT